eukprot:m.57146 g.57146  ORF g.57146 m.57146 type:complete len:619 (+) comp11588_c0_seq3:2195-4051(+)
MAEESCKCPMASGKRSKRSCEGRSVLDETDLDRCCDTLFGESNECKVAGLVRYLSSLFSTKGRNTQDLKCCMLKALESSSAAEAAASDTSADALARSCLPGCRSMCCQPSFADLPTDVVEHIMMFLLDDLTNIVTMFLTCRSWYRLSKNELLWRKICAIKWDVHTQEDRDESLRMLVKQHDFHPPLQKVAPLVKAGVNLRFQYPGCRATPMLAAVFHGHMHVVEFLLNNGSRFDERAERGINGLMLSALKNRVEFVQLFQRKGLSLRDQDFSGNTAYLLASLGGSASVLRYLASERVNKRDKNQYGHTALHMAALGDKVDTLLSHWSSHVQDINTGDLLGRTPLLVAARYANLPSITLLLQRGASLTSRDHMGANLLISATCSKKLYHSGPPESEAARTLIHNLLTQYTHTFSVQDHNVHGQTALHYAFMSQQYEIADQLQGFGADASQQDVFGAKPPDYDALIHDISSQNKPRVKTRLSRLRGLVMDMDGLAAPFGDSEWRFLCSCLQDNTSITRVVLYGTRIVSSDVLEPTLELLAHNRTLCEIQFGPTEQDQLPSSVEEILQHNLRLAELGGFCPVEEVPDGPAHAQAAASAPGAFDSPRGVERAIMDTTREDED